MNKLYIVIPAYNEEENIKSVIKEWYPLVEKIANGSKLVIIDDGSKDSTYNIMKECAKDLPNFIPLSKRNSGHGATILYGYKYAIQSGADYIFQTDSDGQTLAKEFWTLWKQRENHHMLIGHRKKRQDGFSRRVVTKVLKTLIRLSFKENIKDANTPFRLMNAKTLEAIIDLIPNDYNLSNVLISVIYAKKKLSVEYFPITFRPRQGGINSINMKRIVKIGIQAIKDFRQLKKII